MTTPQEINFQNQSSEISKIKQSKSMSRPNSKYSSQKSFNENPSLMIMTGKIRIPINLEDVLIQEDKLWKILDNIRIGCNFNFSAEEYLEFSQVTSIQDYQIFFSDLTSQSIVNNAMIFEYVSAMLCVFVYLENLLSNASMEHLKNLLYYTHQNLILTISLILKI